MPGQIEANSPVVKLSTAGKTDRGSLIRCADDSYSPTDAIAWLKYWQKSESLEFQPDEALALIVTERFPITIRGNATDLLIKKLSKGPAAESDDVVRRILSTSGDRATSAYSLAIALNCGECGGFLLRKYVEIMLDHERSAKDTVFICEHSIDTLFVLDDTSLEMIANQLLFVASRRNAQVHSRACALKAFQKVWLADIAEKGKLRPLTRREMEHYAESLFTSDDEIDLLRVGAFWGMTEVPVVKSEVGKAAIRILADANSHSMDLRECAMRVLPRVPNELAEEAVKVAMKVVRDRVLISDSQIEMVRVAVKTIEKHAKDRTIADAIAAEVANDARMIKSYKQQHKD